MKISVGTSGFTVEGACSVRQAARALELARTSRTRMLEDDLTRDQRHLEDRKTYMESVWRNQEEMNRVLRDAMRQGREEAP
jgi:hypothetical protein